MSNRRVISYCDCLTPKGPCGRVKQVVSETEGIIFVPHPELEELDANEERCPVREEIWVFRTLRCGHIDRVPRDIAAHQNKLSLSFDKLLPFQKDFVEFAEKNGCKVICRDQMGLGKTPESLVLLDQNGALFTDNYKKYCLIVCLPGAIYQWNEEMDNFMSYMSPRSMEDIHLMPQTIFGTGQKLNDMSLVIIIPWSKLGDKKLMAQIEKKGVGGLIVDECHFYKDPNSARTQNLIKLLKLAGPDAPKVMLSGTLTENRVTEMQTALNAIDPQYWSSVHTLANMCLRNDKNQLLGIAPWWRDRFNQITSRYMLGRTKEQVGIPLPLNKDGKPAPQIEYVWVNPRDHKANKEIAEAYDSTLDELEVLLQNEYPDSSSIIGLMQQLRHHTGRMKILSAAMWIETWMICHPGEKLAVGIHHKTVRESLCKLLKARNPLSMSDEDAKEKDRIERAFRDGESNLLICSILSAGTGRNFQFCKNAVILERQWNRSKEDQFSQRFHRIIKDKDGRIKEHFTEEDMVTVYILQAVNSFDEYFHDLVDLKGIIVDSTDENTEDVPEVNFILTLARNVVKKRQKWVGI